MPYLLQDFLQAYIYYFQKQDFRSAEKVCEQIIDTAPHQVEAVYLLGLCMCRMDNPEIGIQLIEEAVVLKPELEVYDFQKESLVQQGVTNIADLLEARFQMYLQHQSINAFLISYPKCGRTWLRLLFGKYVIGEGGKESPLEVLELTRANPEFSSLEITHDDYPHWIPVDKLFTDKRAYVGKKVIFLVRDPRDVLVSNYFQYTKRKDMEKIGDIFGDSLSAFIRHNIGGLRSVVAFYNVWAENRAVPEDFILVTYEDMIKDARKVFSGCLEFLGWPKRPDAFIDEVVDYGRFDNMRKLEETNAFNSARLKPPEDGDPEGFKMRKGKVGGYVDYMSEDDIVYVNDYLAANLDDYYGMYK